MPFCPACGKSVGPEARFCSACGSPANVSVASSATVAPASAATAAVVVPAETYAPAPQVELPRIPEPVIPVVTGSHAGEKPIRAHRPRGVTILGVIAFIGVIITVSLGLVALSYAATTRAESAMPLMRLAMAVFPVLATGQQEIVSEGSATGLTMFLAAAIYGVLGYGLWSLRKWGRISAIVFAALSVLQAIATIVIGGGLLWELFLIGINVWIITYLFKPHVKQAFGA